MWHNDIVLVVKTLKVVSSGVGELNMADEQLETELAYFEEHRNEFLEKAEGKFVLIKGDNSFGFFDSPKHAYEEGVRLFGLEPFLIRQVLMQDQVPDMPAYCLGLIHASL